MYCKDIQSEKKGNKTNKPICFKCGAILKDTVGGWFCPNCDREKIEQIKNAHPFSLIEQRNHIAEQMKTIDEYVQRRLKQNPKYVPYGKNGGGCSVCRCIPCICPDK